MVLVVELALHFFAARRLHAGPICDLRSLVCGETYVHDRTGNGASNGAGTCTGSYAYHLYSKTLVFVWDEGDLLGLWRCLELLESAWRARVMTGTGCLCVHAIGNVSLDGGRQVVRVLATVALMHARVA